MHSVRSITYNDGTGRIRTLQLSGHRKIESSESLGVWVVDGWAWKIFSDRGNAWERVCHDYTGADRLRLLATRTSWTPVAVDYDDDRATEGFAIISPFIDDTKTSYRPFDCKHDTRTLEAIVRDIDDISTLQRIERAFRGAQCLKLKDPQGFIDTSVKNNRSVLFIDVRSHSVPSASVSTVCKCLGRRINELEQTAC